MRDRNPIFDDNIVCPISGEPLIRDGNVLRTGDGAQRYDINDGIHQIFVDAEPTPRLGFSKVNRRVQEFYTDAPFPDYNDFDDIAAFIERANQGVFARILREQIAGNSRVLEVGCGTGQLSNFLSATTTCRVYATDLTFASLRLGMKFAVENDIKRIKFIQMNLFHPCIKKHSMDVVISIGVLHHTANPNAAFLSIAPLVKPGGHIIVGLYNRIGRLRTVVRRGLYQAFGQGVLVLDPHLRKQLSADKRRAWILDQYHHPQESRHTLAETLDWFAEAGFTFVSSIPKIVGNFAPDERIFEPQSPGTALDRHAAAVGMLFSHHGGEGGLHVMIGRRM